jgi:hypothetical protein
VYPISDAHGSDHTIVGLVTLPGGQSHEMIFKIKQPLEGQWFKRKACAFKPGCTPRECYAEAIFVHEPFIYESAQGWIQGFKNMWLLDIGHGARMSICGDAFKLLYEPLANGEAPPLDSP